MEKVKVTQKQAEAIERFKEEQRNAFVFDKHKFVKWAEPLKSLNVDEYMDALYIGYEVEPEFNVGDWVFNKQTNVIFKLEPGFEKNVNSDVKKKFFRHATPEEIAEEKERRWWAKHNRGFRQFKPKDIIRQHNVIYEVMQVREESMQLNDWGKEVQDIFYSSYDVVCFAEDRKDVDNE